jgi:hypothetical protein
MAETKTAGRVRSGFAASKSMLHVALRDPEHIPERLTLYANEHLAEPSREWADAARRERPDTPPAEIAEELRVQSAKVARLDGAIAGTPFFIALVPGYVAYLWQEGRMGLRIAALYGREPASLRTAAEMLVLRGVHPTADEAEAALEQVRAVPLPDKPDERRPLRSWVHSVRQILVFGGFLAPSPDERPTKLRTALGVLLAATLWIVTCLFPVSLMIALAWGCETHARQLGRRVVAFYGGEAETPQKAISLAERIRDRGHDKRQLVRGAALALSFAVPIAFVVYANHVRQDTGISWVAALGALVALAIVIATSVIASRR